MTFAKHTALDDTPWPLDHLAERGERNAPALVLKDRVLTHGELSKRVSLLAGWLERRLEPGARVASWAAKGELTCLLPLAAARAGMVHVPINPLLKRAQASHILVDSGATLLIATASRLKSLEDGDIPADCAALDEADRKSTRLNSSHNA